MFEIERMAPRYDFNAATPGNGWRSVVCVVDTLRTQLSARPSLIAGIGSSGSAGVAAERRVGHQNTVFATSADPITLKSILSINQRRPGQPYLPLSQSLGLRLNPIVP